MKYVFLFCNTPDELKQWEGMPEDQKQQAYELIGEWWNKQGSKITAGQELKPASTATTVRVSRGSPPAVSSGPFVPSNEVIGGFAVVEVSDLQEAIAIAQTWPAGSVEIRAVVEDQQQAMGAAKPIGS